MSLLKQVKGVGTQIALTYVLTIEDPHRFRANAARFATERRRGLLDAAAAKAKPAAEKIDERNCLADCPERGDQTDQ